MDTNAFLYWWLVTEKTDGEGLVNINLSNNTYTLNKRLFTLGNYARFVRPEYVRIDATANPAANIFTTAYRDPASNQFVVVVINDNPTTQTIDLTPSGFSATSVTPYVTDSTRNLVQLASVPLASVSLAAKSVTTFVGSRDGRWSDQHPAGHSYPDQHPQRDCHAQRPDQYASGDTRRN